MKIKNSLTLIGLIVLFFSFPAIAQEEPNEVSPAEERTDDSLVVVVPVQGQASLNLIVPPDGFEPTDKFNGYIHLQASSGIIMTMIENANYMKICEGMTEDFFLQNGLTFLEKTDFVSDNRVNGTYYKFSFIASEVPFIRYVVYAGDLNKTLWLNITYPTKLEHLVEQELLKSIQSITLKDNSDEK